MKLTDTSCSQCGQVSGHHAPPLPTLPLFLIAKIYNKCWQHLAELSARIWPAAAQRSLGPPVCKPALGRRHVHCADIAEGVSSGQRRPADMANEVAPVRSRPAHSPLLSSREMLGRNLRTLCVRCGSVLASLLTCQRSTCSCTCSWLGFGPAKGTGSRH